MAKKKSDKEDLAKQVNFRITEALYNRVEKTANTMGLDMANLLRMIVIRALPAYERQAEDIRHPE